MTAFANIAPAPEVEGTLYASATPLTSQEADLYNQATPTLYPIPTNYIQAIQAVVKLTMQGQMNSNTAYVVLQTDMGDGVWIDVAWVRCTLTSGSFIGVLSGGSAGANAFQQSRGSGTDPGSNGSNQIALGGRCRFVGKASVSQSSSQSSAAPGVATLVAATIRYRVLPLR